MTVRFGSSGIRGRYGTVVTEDLAFRVGAAVGLGARRVVVGRDARTSSPSLAAAFAAGAAAVGAVATDVGCVPTPTLAYATRGHDAGAVVTASHNPPDDNGIKLWNPDGSAFDARQRAAVEAALGADAPTPVDTPPLVEGSALEAHAGAVLASVPPPERALRVVLDAGHGPGALLTPALLRRAGHRVTTLHADLDGRFRGRPSEPTAANLADLRALVPAIGADLGLAHDGDADRLVAVDGAGRVLDGDATLALLARATGAKRLVVSADTSRLVWDALPGADVRLAKVGDAYVSERLKVDGGDLGGEPSGAFIFPRVSYCPDGPHAALALAAFVAREGPLATLAAALPRYARVREAVAVPPGRGEAVVAAAAERLARLGEASALDGCRVDVEGGWLLVRASGTEPKVRIQAEAQDAAAAERLASAARDAVAAALP